MTGCFEDVSAKKQTKQNETDEESMPVCGVSNDGLNDPNLRETPDVFKMKCATCHHIKHNGTGPALAGFMKKAPSEEWFKGFITNQDSMLRAGDSLTLQIQELRPSKGMHQQILTQKQIDELIEYIR